MYMDLNIGSLTKRGYKKITKGDSLNESIASAVLFNSGFIENYYSKIINSKESTENNKEYSNEFNKEHLKRFKNREIIKEEVEKMKLKKSFDFETLEKKMEEFENKNNLIDLEQNANTEVDIPIIHNDKKKIIEKKNPKILWDPFCGCGTLLIENLLIQSEIPLRNFKDLAYFNDFKFITNCSETYNEYKKYIKIQKDFYSVERNNKNLALKLLKKKLQSNKNSSYNLVGSDISGYAIKATVENFKHSGLFDEIRTEENTNENPMILKSKINSITEIYLGAYEIIFDLLMSKLMREFKEKEKDNKFIQSFFSTFKNYKDLGTKKILNCSSEEKVKLNELYNELKTEINSSISILTHLPYKVNDNNFETKKLYSSFGKFIRKNYEVFSDIVVLVEKRDKKDALNFIRNSGLEWSILSEMNNHGIDTQLIKLKKNSELIQYIPNKK